MASVSMMCVAFSLTLSNRLKTAHRKWGHWAPPVYFIQNEGYLYEDLLKSPSR